MQTADASPPTQIKKKKRIKLSEKVEEVVGRKQTNEAAANITH